MLSARREETFTVIVTWLVVPGSLVTPVWTRCRLFSVPLEPLSISFHLFTL